MSNIKNVCVYCGSSSRVDESYKEAAANLGKNIAEAGWGVVYGGGRVGLMGIVADTALKHGVHVKGIIPEHIQSREIEHTDLSELVVVDTMHQRKQIMVDSSDAFVILPGGLGTLDELFEIATWKQLGLHDKPIVIVNMNDYWTKLIEALHHVAGEGFMREEDLGLFHLVGSVDEVVEALKNAPQEKFDPSTKWI
ncbi:MAG: TIGR00730 family Rossman fold protein [Pseudomonadota bacterium]